MSGAYQPCGSPNHGARPDGAVIDMVILHYTGMESGGAALTRLCDKAAQVSAHYLVEEDGRLFALVPEERRAWHAGVSYWAGDRDINSRSIGIEIVNPGHEFGYRDFPEEQLVAIETLLSDIAARHSIPQAHYLGHSDVAPARKEDPGERFPWARFAALGFGLWPEGAVADMVLITGDSLTAYQAALAQFGYEIKATGVLDDETRIVTRAFQRHFVPGRIGTVGEGIPDACALATAQALCHLAGH